MKRLEDIIAERILILDGAMGTSLIARGNKGVLELLNVEAPGVVEQLHEEYLQAGADIITTNTFNANALSLAPYNLQEHVSEINLSAATLARQLADKYTTHNPDKQRWVAGSVGPTALNCNSSEVDADKTFALLADAYTTQMEALIAGGVDLLLVETICNLTTAQAALHAAECAMKRTQRTIPIMLSITTTPEGTMLSGHTLDAFVTAVSRAPILSVGINCSYGAATLLPQLRTLSRIAPCYISTHPNAGIPDEAGRYKTTANDMAKVMRTFIDEGLVNIVGGCCGTTPQLTALLCQATQGATPRRLHTLS
jgi:5-methyltetrahydrofolate--homocysteine methyltransferase